MNNNQNRNQNQNQQSKNQQNQQEWLYKMKRPHDLEEARRLMADIIDFYNNKRPHRSNQGMLPPTISSPSRA